MAAPKPTDGATAAAEVEVDLDADDAHVAHATYDDAGAAGASGDADADGDDAPPPQSGAADYDSEPDDLDQYVAETTAAPIPALPTDGGAAASKDPEVALVQRELTGEVGLLTRDLRDAQRALSARQSTLDTTLSSSSSSDARVRQTVDEFVAYSTLCTQLTARLKSAATRLSRLNANPTRHVAGAMSTVAAEPEQDEVQLAQLVLRRAQDELNQDLRAARRAQAVRDAAVAATGGSGAAKAEADRGQRVIDQLATRLQRVADDAEALKAAAEQTRRYEEWARETMAARANAKAAASSSGAAAAAPAGVGAVRSPVAGSAAAGAQLEVANVLSALKAEHDALQTELHSVKRALSGARAELRAVLDNPNSGLDAHARVAAVVARTQTHYVQSMARAMSVLTRIEAVETHPTAASAVAAAAVTGYGDSAEDDLTRALHVLNGERDAVNREVRAQRRALATADADLAADPKNPITAKEAAKLKSVCDALNTRLSAVVDRVDRLQELQRDLARDTERARTTADAAAAVPARAPAATMKQASPPKAQSPPKPAPAAAGPSASPHGNVVARQSGAVNGDAVVRMLNDQFRFLHLPREVTSFGPLQGTSAPAQFICEIVEAFAEKYGVTAADGAAAAPADTSSVNVSRVTRVLDTMARLTGIDTAGYGLNAQQLLAGDGAQVAHLVLLIDVLFRSLAAPAATDAPATDASSASRHPSPIKAAGPTTHASVNETTMTFGSSAIVSPSRVQSANPSVGQAHAPLIASASKPKVKKQVHVDSNASQTIPASPMAAASPHAAGVSPFTAASRTGAGGLAGKKSRRAEEQAAMANTAGLEDDPARAGVYARDLHYLASHAAAEKREAAKRAAQTRAAEQKYNDENGVDDGYDYDHVPVDDGEGPSAGRSRGTASGGRTGPPSTSSASVLERRAERLAGELERLRDHRMAAQRKTADLVARAQMTAAERDAYERGLLRRREAVLAQQQQAGADAAYDAQAEPGLRKSQDELDALRHIAQRARRKHEQKTGQSGVTGASARASIVNHGNELLAAARRREDKQTFNSLKRMMAHTNVKRTAVGLERGQMDMERDLITRDVRRQAWLENATAQGVSFATSARAARVAGASAQLDDTAVAMNGGSRRRRSRSPTHRTGTATFGEFSPFAKPKGAAGARGSGKKKGAKPSAGAAGAGASAAAAAAAARERAAALAAADKRYFTVQRKQHKTGDEQATTLVWEEIAAFEKKLRSQVSALNQFYTDQIGAVKDESVSVRARKKLQAEAVRELQRDIKAHQDKIKKLLGDELDHRDEHYRYVLESQIPHSDGGQEWSRPPDTYVSYSWS